MACATAGIWHDSQWRTRRCSLPLRCAPAAAARAAAPPASCLGVTEWRAPCAPTAPAQRPACSRAFSQRTCEPRLKSTACCLGTRCTQPCCCCPIAAAPAPHLEQIGQVGAKALQHRVAQRLRVRRHPLLQRGLAASDERRPARVRAHPVQPARGRVCVTGCAACSAGRRHTGGANPRCCMHARRPHQSSANGLDSSIVEPLSAASLATCAGAPGSAPAPAAAATVAGAICSASGAARLPRSPQLAGPMRNFVLGSGGTAWWRLRVRAGAVPQAKQRWAMRSAAQHGFFGLLQQ